MAQPPTTQAPGTSLEQQLIDAYSKMRAGLLLIFVSWLLLIVAIFAGLGAMLAAIGFGGPRGPGEGMAAAIAAAASIGVVVLIALVIQLIGLFAKFIPGTKDLARADASFSTASKLISVGYTWGLILLVIGILMLIAAAASENPGIALGTLGILFIGAILMFIGYVGIIILAIKLHGKEGETLYLVAGILMILFFLPYLGAILQIIAWILFYLALGHSIEKLELSSPGVSAQPV